MPASSSRDGSTRLAVSSGGHPLPVVLRAGGEVESAGEPGTLLGVVPDPDLSCAEMELFRGDTLVFYTDGITEARTPQGLFGHEGLLRALRACAGCDAAEIAERIDQSMLDVQTGGLRDDVALVVVQISEGAGAADRGEPALHSALDEELRSRPQAPPAARQGAAFGERFVAVLDATGHLAQPRDPVLRRRVRGEHASACGRGRSAAARSSGARSPGCRAAATASSAAEIARSADARPCG